MSHSASLQRSLSDGADGTNMPSPRAAADGNVVPKPSFISVIFCGGAGRSANTKAAAAEPATQEEEEEEEEAQDEIEVAHSDVTESDFGSSSEAADRAKAMAAW